MTEDREITDAGDEEQVAQRQKKRKTQHEIAILEMRDVLDTQAGRNILWRILSECGIFRSEFTNDIAIAANASAKRALGLWLISEMIAAKPDAFMILQREALARGDKQMGTPENV